MDTEANAQKVLDESQTALFEAINLIEKMSTLRGKLNIKDGAGQRYLNKIRPDMRQLKQAESEILKNYSGKALAPAKKRKNLMSALHRHGRA